MSFKYFSHSDFKSATPECRMDQMDSGFLDKLDAAREIASVPFVINSAYRSIEYEKNQGRSGDSSHTKGVAVDIKADTSRQRFLILDALRKVGFTRIGIGETYIHCDLDSDKDQQVIWHYY